MILFGQPLIAGVVPRFHHFAVLCGHSLTVAWSYFMFIASGVLEALMQWPDISNTLGLQQYLPPRVLPLYMIAIGLITLGARMRTLQWRWQRHVDEEHKDEDHA
jgi:TRAP-type C4-dicarboxylate transport system permease small subunit